MARTHLTMILGAALTVLSAAPSFAGPDALGNYVQNGGFEQTTATSSVQMNTSNVANWSTSGYNFIYLADPTSASGTTADTTGASGSAGNVKLWGPGDGSANGLTTSPVGGNFIAADDNYGQGAVTQTITGLTAGLGYELKFYWAAAQQAGFNGVTQEQWSVTFGNQTKSTNTINLDSHAFAGWYQSTMTFVASATSQTLSFLATGTPGGAPPFSLLDGVSLMAVPEPATWGVLASALVGVGLLTAYRRRTPRATGGTAA